MSTQKQNPRELRGLAIASTEGMVTRIDETIFSVKSQSNQAISYLVTKSEHLWNGKLNGYIWRCTCPDSTYRKVVCKHAYACQLNQLLRAKAENKNFGFSIELDEPVCLSCGAKELIKSGLRKNRYGDVQRYKCQSCNFRFTVNLGFQKMKNSPKIITLIMDLYVKGISTRKVVQHLQDFYDLKVDQSTVVRYVQRYTEIIKNFVDEAVTPNFKNPVWHMDETMINIKNTEKMGKGFYSYAWTVMDSHTRFLLAMQISKHRTVSDGVTTLKKAEKVAQGKPMAVITDSYQWYSQIVKDVFYTREKPRPLHIKTKAIAKGMDNVRIERQFGELKDRTKVMRGIGNDKSAQIYADLHTINHNFIKPHMALNNRTPAQVAGINLPLGKNKWLGLIKISARNKKFN
jgi:transposase-like protein